jgi:carbon-monoxide dehydrogenase small subunit
MPIEFRINDESVVYHGDARRSLLSVLREDLRLTGSKDVCREGFCGACTVHLDDRPVAACLVPVGKLHGADVTTIEGLAPLTDMTPVQRAFVEYDVVQCGMCFPGMVMTMTKFLEQNPKPTRTEVKSAMVGNLCRCTGYERIVDAVMSVQDQQGGLA